MHGLWPQRTGRLVRETKQLNVLEDKNLNSRDFPGDPVVGSPGRLPLQVLQVQFLEEELGSFMTHSEAKKENSVLLQ